MKAILMVILGAFSGIMSCGPNAKVRTVQSGDIVLTHFALSLADGTRLDESRHHHTRFIQGQPLKFKVGNQEVIKGWDQIVLGMKKGEFRKIIIPPALGYGIKGALDNIHPEDTLILEVELIDWAD